MSEARLVTGEAAIPRLAAWLRLAAMPGFAAMALLTAVAGPGAADGLCMAGRGWALGGMVPMYLLMSMVHASPWLAHIAELRGNRRGPS